MENDVKLIQDCIRGIRPAQNELYNRFAPKMFAVCLRYSRTRHEAEEVLQEGFVQVFISLKQFRNEGSFEGWIRRIMVFTGIRFFKANRNVIPIISTELYQADTCINENVSAEISTKEMMQLVQALPPACRLVFNLYVFEGMKHREIAELLSISEGTSKSNLFDAKAILQKGIKVKEKFKKENVLHG